MTKIVCRVCGADLTGEFEENDDVWCFKGEGHYSDLENMAQDLGGVDTVCDKEKEKKAKKMRLKI
jgi:hypothetical protein